jgi:hypothetical protein
MFGTGRGWPDRRDNPVGLSLALGVLRVPVTARQRWRLLATLLPGGRRPAGAHRRPRHGGSPAAAGTGPAPEP